MTNKNTVTIDVSKLLSKRQLRKYLVSVSISEVKPDGIYVYKSSMGLDTKLGFVFTKRDK